MLYMIKSFKITRSIWFPHPHTVWRSVTNACSWQYYIYIYIYIYTGGMYIYIYLRFRGASPACPTPRNREIGFVSSSFSFRACHACRASGRGEAKLCGCACVDRCPYRWAFLELGSTRVPSSWRRYLQRRRVGFNDICIDLVAPCWFVDANSMVSNILIKFVAVIRVGF